MHKNEDGSIEHDGKTYYPEEAVKTAYMLGVQAQKSSRQSNLFSEYLVEKHRRRIELVCEANRKLLEQIMSLDETDTLAGLGIPIDREFVLNVIKELRDNNNKSGRANLLQSQINKHDQDWNKIFKNVEKEMREIVDE